MFVLYKIIDEVTILTQEYTKDASSAIKDCVFTKYLFKINELGLCVRIKSVELLDNTILRKDANLLVRLSIEMIVLKLSSGEYFEGTVKEINHQGIIISFMGILEGQVKPEHLHKNSLYDDKTWFLVAEDNKMYVWRVGETAKFKIHTVDWNTKKSAHMHQLLSLRCDQPGLGLASWWL